MPKTIKLTTEQIESVKEALLDNLPHGGGINHTWNIEYKPRTGLWYASNNYDAMDEMGGYCHVYPFTAVYFYYGPDKKKCCPYCDGRGTRLISNLAALRHSTFDNTVQFLQSSNHIINMHSEPDDIQEPEFICNVCQGKGYIALPVFELVRINYHGIKESACCGFGLHEYLEQVLTFVSDFIL
jgi:hypothetical protein